MNRLRTFRQVLSITKNFTIVPHRFIHNSKPFDKFDKFNIAYLDMSSMIGKKCGFSIFKPLLLPEDNLCVPKDNLCVPKEELIDESRKLHELRKSDESHELYKIIPENKSQKCGQFANDGDGHKVLERDNLHLPSNFYESIALILCIVYLGAYITTIILTLIYYATLGILAIVLAVQSWAFVVTLY